MYGHIKQTFAWHDCVRFAKKLSIIQAMKCEAFISIINGYYCMPLYALALLNIELPASLSHIITIISYNCYLLFIRELCCRSGKICITYSELDGRVQAAKNRNA